MMAGLIGVGCSLSGGLRYHNAEQASARQHRERLEIAIRSSPQPELNAGRLVQKWRAPEPDRVTRTLKAVGFTSFGVLSLLLVVCKDARSGFAILLWFAWIIPNAFAGLTD